MQVDPIKPTLKAPGTEHLTLKYDKLVSCFAFKLCMRRYILALMDALGVRRAALLGHSAGAPVALDAALMSPERCAALLMVAPAVFVGEKPSAEPAAKPSGGGFTPPLDRALRFAWLRFLISQDATGLNYVRGSVGRQIAAIEVEPYTGPFFSSA